jgi:hypothetical protein
MGRSSRAKPPAQRQDEGCRAQPRLAAALVPRDARRPLPEVPNMETRASVTQKTDARFERVRAQVFSCQALFVAGASVPVTWRNRDGRRSGSYFRVPYREG